MKLLALPLTWTAAVVLAASAGAAPDCSSIGPNTRMCSNPGHAAIVTSPDPTFTDPGPGWGFGTLRVPVIPNVGVGGGGFWLGM